MAVAVYNFFTDFEQFFCNRGYDVYHYALRDFDRVGTVQMRKLATESCEVIDRLKKTDLKSLWDILKYLTDQEHEKLQEIFDEICRYEENVFELVYETYCNGKLTKSASQNL